MFVLLTVIAVLVMPNATALAQTYKKVKIRTSDEVIEGLAINNYDITFELPEDWIEAGRMSKDAEGADYFRDDGIVSPAEFKKCFPDKKKCVLYLVTVGKFFPHSEKTPKERLKKYMSRAKNCTNSTVKQLRVPGLQAAGAFVCENKSMPNASYQAAHTILNAYYYMNKVRGEINVQEIWDDADPENKAREETRPIFYKDWLFKDIHDHVVNSVSLQFKPGKVYHEPKRATH